MYSETLINRIIELLGQDFVPREESEAKYPARSLPEGAEVMRVPPSPTGFVHIGTIYAGLVNERIAHQSGGKFILRIEDTDIKREVEGSAGQIIEAFSLFGLNYDEGPEVDGSYGPYYQSKRGQIYLGYAIDLLKKGRAYPCFASPEELQENIKKQQQQKLRPGYYGDWAVWRNKSEDDIKAALDAGKPFVLRFRSEGSHHKRIHYTDLFKGKMEVPENDLDVPLIKSDESRLPTYHLAHVVDDYLMRVTKVFRSDEWLPSTALHIELSQALGHEPFTYGHFAPISIIDKNSGGKRKLSKRKDDEADVQYWVDAGYPVEGVKAYLLGLANSNFEDWYRANPGKSLEEFPVSLEKLSASRAPLLDMTKLEDYCKEFIASLSQDKYEVGVRTVKNPDLINALNDDPSYTSKVLAVERTGDKPRKDLAKWSDAYELYGYFFDTVFESDFKNRIKVELKDLPAENVQAALQRYLSDYNFADSSEEWLAKARAGAEETGLHMRDYTKIIRVRLTGKSRTPDLYTIQQVMGDVRVRSRLL
jgi:glutamyl-tRNA synthetase